MAGEILERENLEGEENKFENMTEEEKEAWATQFLREKGFSVSGGKPGAGKEDAMKRSWSGASKKPGSHGERKHK